MNFSARTPDRVREEIVALLPRLRRYCATLAGNRDMGDDLMQSAVERALMHLDRFTPGTRLDSWVYRIARNIFIDQLRAERVRGGHPVPFDEIPDVAGDDGQAIVDARSDLASATLAFAALPTAHREIFSLVVIDGMSYRDAADLLEIPVGTVMSRLARARSAIELSVTGGVA